MSDLDESLAGLHHVYACFYGQECTADMALTFGIHVGRVLVAAGLLKSDGELLDIVDY